MTNYVKLFNNKRRLFVEKCKFKPAIYTSRQLKIGEELLKLYSVKQETFLELKNTFVTT